MKAKEQKAGDLCFWLEKGKARQAVLKALQRRENMSWAWEDREEQRKVCWGNSRELWMSWGKELACTW